MSGETTLERMARAIAIDDGFTVEALSKMDGDARVDPMPEYRKNAKAALLAIREPLLNIQDAGWEAAVENEGCTPECCWVAMIDAILNEQSDQSVTHQTGD